ncbi:hypothetical protein N9F27_03930, partial [Crocinitomicaceae bacterium]|nr:hypothetical protein [Crocinitomicaceae bacterium]
MNANKNRILNALLVSAFFLVASTGFTQSYLELLPGSERATRQPHLHATSLAGNVVFTYQGNTMYCDSALYYDKTNKVRAFGNVHITKPGGLNLFCDYLSYDGNTETAFLSGNVRARDQEYKLTTKALEYDT